MWRVALRVWDAQLLEIVDGLTYVPLLDVFGGLDLETMRSPKEDAQAGPHADAQCEPLPNPPRALNPYTQSPNPSPRPLNQTPYALSPSPRP